MHLPIQNSVLFQTTIFLFIFPSLNILIFKYYIFQHNTVTTILHVQIINIKKNASIKVAIYFHSHPSIVSFLLIPKPLKSGCRYNYIAAEIIYLRIIPVVSKENDTTTYFNEITQMKV